MSLANNNLIENKGVGGLRSLPLKIVYNLEPLSTFLAKCNIRDKTNTAKKMKNKIWAIPALLAAIPPKPNIPAINATIKNTIDQ